MTTFRRRQSLQTVTAMYARDFVGQGEVGGNNRGPMVTYMLRAANLDPGAAWCAAFLNYCAECAACLKNVWSPLDQVPLQGLVQSYADWAKQNGLVVQGDHKVSTGDLVCLDTGRTDRKYDHMALVDGRRHTGEGYPTVEGNVSASAEEIRERDGDVVAMRVRQFDELDPLFIRWGGSR